MQAMQNCFKKSVFLGFLLSTLILTMNAQEGDAPKHVYHFNGNVTVTNNGFSLIPTFSLGKPATLGVFSIGGERFSMDPQIRFDLEGFKPWSFIFMWRYKVIRSDKFLLQAGLHFPAIAFTEYSVEINGQTMDRSIPVRYFTPEVTTTYMLSERIGIGMYYLYGKGLEKEGQTQNTHFISLRAYFNRIPLGKQLFINWNPQVYYLSLDGTDGVFMAQFLELGHRKVPVSISSMMNFKIKSDIQVQDFDWNIGLVYSFGAQFTRK